MSYQQVPVKIVRDAVMEYRVVGPSDTEPTPESGYLIDPEAVEIAGVQGKFWVEFKITEV